MGDTNGPPPTRLELFLHGLRIRITSEPGVLPYTFEVNGLEMREGYFRHLCAVAGVNYDDVVRAVQEGNR